MLTVHLELIFDLTAAKYISALRLVLLRWGKRCIIYSNDGNTFKRAYKDFGYFGKIKKDKKTSVLFYENSLSNSPHCGGRLLRELMI